MKIFKIAVCVLFSGIILGLGAALLLAYWQNAEREQNDAVVDDIVFEEDIGDVDNGGGIVWDVSDGRSGVVFIVDGVEYEMRSRLLHTTQPPGADGRAITARGLPETRAQTAYLAPFVQTLGELEIVVFSDVLRDRGFSIYHLSNNDWRDVYEASDTTNILETIDVLRSGEYLLIIYFIYGSPERGSSGVEYSIRFFRP